MIGGSGLSSISSHVAVVDGGRKGPKMLFMKFLCLFLVVLFTTSMVLKVQSRQGFPAWHFIVHAIGVAGFISLQWLR